MSRPVLTPLVVALSAFLVAPQIQAEPTAPLFVVEQQRSALVTRLAKQWSDAFAILPKERRLTHEQLSSALWALRADRLFAVTLAGEVEAIEAVLGERRQDALKSRVSTKSLGDATADLTYTPINPCRILDTRSTAAGPLAPNVARTFDGYSTNFAIQGGTGSGCGIPNGIAALAMNVYAVNPTNLGFIKVWPANGTEPDVSTVNYQVGLTAIATGALVPVDAANSNRFTAESPATVDFIADVVGYFKPPGDATSLDIKVAGVRVVRYERDINSPNVIGGIASNVAHSAFYGQTVGGGGTLGNDCWEPSNQTYTRSCANSVSGHYSTVAGGVSNVSGADPSLLGYGGTTVSGGRGNSAIFSGATVGGGAYNAALQASTTIAGGIGNTTTGLAATVGGGGHNGAGGYLATVSGGESNIANGNHAAVPGGQDNVASGWGSLAAGSRARSYSADATPVIHDGVFIWADRPDPPPPFHSAAPNEFAARSTGGVRFVTAIDQSSGSPTWTCGVSGGAGGSWGCSSDRELKTDLIPLDAIATLERLAALPVYQWAAKDDPRRTPHAGPTAQDFMAAFGLGDNDKMIGFADAQGVAFAAIQGLNAKFDAAIAERDARIVKQDEEIAELRRAVEVLLTRTSPEGRVAERR